MSDLVEKVARVLCIKDGEPDPDRVLKLYGYPVAWTYYVDEARAAIAAVAEWLDDALKDDDGRIYVRSFFATNWSNRNEQDTGRNGAGRVGR